MSNGTQGDVREHVLMRVFPPPAFLHMPAVGVDVSDKSIKYVELPYRRGSYALGAFGDIPFDENVVVGGEIRNEKRLIKALRAFKEKVNKRFVRASLPEQKAYFFTTDVPRDARHEQIIKTLEFKLEEHVPLSSSEAVVDYDRLATKRDERTEETIEVGVTVYPKETVMRYAHVFFEAGLFPLSFEIEAQALQRAVVKKGERGTSMVVDLGETSIGLSIVSRGLVAFTSTLETSGAQFTEIFMRECSVPQSAVSALKNSIGIHGSSTYPALKDRLHELLGKLSEEMERHRLYWNTHADEEDVKKPPIERIILCGGNANMKGLPEYFEKLLKLPTERANVWQNVLSFDDIVPDISYEASFSYGTAIGLALRREN